MSRRVAWVVGWAVVLGVGSGTLLASVAPPAVAAGVVATVDGVPVTTADLGEAIEEVRGSCPGLTAPELATRAFELCRHDVTLERLAEGTIEGAGYTSRRAAWSEENARRARALARGETVFGPIALSWAQYRQWRRDRLGFAVAKIFRTQNPTTPKDEIGRRCEAYIAHAAAAAHVIWTATSRMPATP